MVTFALNRPKFKPLLIVTTYKLPNVKEANFIDSPRDSFAEINLDKIGPSTNGYSNIDQLGKSSANRLFKSFATKQLINEATRITENSKSLIDLILTNREHKTVQSGIIHTTLSDHSLVF